MFGKRIKLFTLLGFDVSVDFSWILIAFLITWSLAAGVFPSFYRGLTATVYWTMGIAGAAGLFGSIIVHEFSHSLVAKKFGLPMKGITLFVFGGVAEMEDEPPNPRAEFMMAVAGPLSSIAIGGAILLAVRAIGRDTIPIPLYGVLQYLGSINLILAAFNLIPAFPLDGGRILRAALWQWRKDIRAATRIASFTGNVFGFVLIALGVYNLLRGGFIGGIWWILLGMFVWQAAQMSYQQLLIRRALQGEPVWRFMNDRPVTVSEDIPIDRFVYEYVYHYHHKIFPLIADHVPLRCVTTRDIHAIDRDEWARHTVAEIARPCSDDNTLFTDTDAVNALSRMNRTGNSRMLVTDRDGALKGVITLKDLMGFLSAKLDLEGDTDDFYTHGKLAHMHG